MARARPGAGGAKVEAAGGRSGPARVRATAGGRRLRRGGRTPVPAPPCAGRTHGRRLGGSAARRLGGSAARRLGGSADIIDRALAAIVNPPSGLSCGECPGSAAALSPTPYPLGSPLMAVSTRRRRFRPMVHARRREFACQPAPTYRWYTQMHPQVKCERGGGDALTPLALPAAPKDVSVVRLSAVRNGHSPDGAQEIPPTHPRGFRKRGPAGRAAPQTPHCPPHAAAVRCGTCAAVLVR